MVTYYLLRDGTGEQRLASQGTIPLEVIVGRRFSTVYEALPTFNISGFSGPANSVGEPNCVVILIDNPAEAKRLGATPGRYHVVRDFTPTDLTRALAAVRPVVPPV